MVRRGDESAFRFTNEELAVSACRVHALSMDGGLDSGADMEAWERVIELAVQLAKDEADGLKFSDMAAMLFRQFKAKWQVEAEYTDLPPIPRAAWEAVARHLVNMLTCDDDIDLKEHEDRWRNWAIDRVYRLQQTQQVQPVTEGANG